MRSPALPALLSLLVSAAACDRGDRERELAECVTIHRTMYVTGQVRDCLVRRYGWSAEDAAAAERERLGAHPDSASRSDSGRIGDSAGR
jgi:hypothetical protein